MNKKLRSLLLAGSLGMLPQLNAQNSNVAFFVPPKNGSVFMSLTEKHLGKAYISQHLVTLLGLSTKHSFTQTTETVDQLGFTHTGYQQYFQGILVDNGLILVHYKNGMAESINGRIAVIGKLNTTPSLNKQKALMNAAKELDIVKIVKQYPVSLVISQVGAGKLPEYLLTYKVRIDGQTAKKGMVMMNVFIDAQTGKVLKKVSLMALADVNGSAKTLYSGTQTIVMDDSIPNLYRLKDNARKIITYDVTNAELNYDTTVFEYFLNPQIVGNPTTMWEKHKALMILSLDTPSTTLQNAIYQANGTYMTFTVLKDTSNDLANAQYKCWPDYKFDYFAANTFPMGTANLFIYPEEDTSYLGSFGLSNYNYTDPPAMQYGGYAACSNLSYGIHNWADGTGNAGRYFIDSTANPALDVHWGMERTYDFYNQTFNRNSYDGNGSVLKNYVNGMWPQTLSQNNASALPGPYFSMVYGLGDGSTFNALVALDIIGHEFTHMVTETNGHGGLDYSGESGALNESFSDIMGTCIEFYVRGNAANWNVGEDCGTIYYRSMSDPQNAPAHQPDTYEGAYWDLSDPHVASGVQNKWFYLLTIGGWGTNDKLDNYNVTGIGIDKAAQIAYRNLTQYLTPGATFMDSYTGSLQAAKDLYGDTSAAYSAVKDAWFAVGIGEVDTTHTPPTAVSSINNQQQYLQFSPNPAKNSVTISSGLPQKISAVIINAVGVKQMNVTINKGSNVVNIQNLAKGIYFIKYNINRQFYTQRLSVL